jgi:hypothetical protein
VPKSKIPGYSGFIRGSQHISGITFGNMSRDTQEQNFVTTEASNALPSPIAANIDTPNNVNYKHKLPGYTGHVRGYREEFGKSYGSTTCSLLAPAGGAKR